MANAKTLDEYLESLRSLLRLDPARWRVVVERQILGKLLPQIAGPRAVLEPKLWELLILCLEGHEADVPEKTDELWEEARGRAADGRGLTANEAVFPRAAVEVAMVLVELHETGVYPAPRAQAG